ncbi:hypothetical protein [Nocardia sp. IFM 10818]
MSIDIDDLEVPEIVLDTEPALPATGLALCFASRSDSRSQSHGQVPDRRVGVGGPRRARIVAGAAVVAISVVAVAALPDRTGRQPASGEQAPAAVAVWRSPTLSGPVSSGNAPGCAQASRERDLAAMVAGAGVMRAEGGVAAIEVFEAAYYRVRDARRARQMVAAAAAIPPVAQIQAGIDSIPAATTYCAHITALDHGLYAVEVAESRADGTGNLWRQRISTSEVGDGTLITAITHL